MPDLLVEVGCEELPASDIFPASQQLGRSIALGLEEVGIDHGELVAMGTPRRLIVFIPNIGAVQPDREKTTRGPAVGSSYDSEGTPSKALLGFCKGQGVDPAETFVENDYVWAKVQVKGVASLEILRTLIPEAIAATRFEKSMRWGASRLKFARPIRWIVALLGEVVLPFDIEGVESGRHSVGHRFLSPETFEVTHFQDFLTQLRRRFVEPDPAVRRQVILDGANACGDGKVLLDERLIDENVFLTEWPEVLTGTFRSEFLELPRPVLITAMAKHERFFPVEDATGNLVNRFISVRNGGDADTVREGNAWVLNARFNDARFFYELDKSCDLQGFLERTEGIHFQESLGSIRKRADRLSILAGKVSLRTHGDDRLKNLLELAGKYAKADLSTGLVSELPSLQGVIGAEYARREGLSETVAWAIGSQYDLDSNLPADSEEKLAGIQLLIADQLDKLAGFLGLGLEPSGSSDPYGLRRATTQLVEACWALPKRPPSLSTLFAEALACYRDQGIDLNEESAYEAFRRMVRARYENLLPDVRYDILDAALGQEESDACFEPQRIRLSLRVLPLLVHDVPFVQVATRPINILAAAREKAVHLPSEVSLSALDTFEFDSKEAITLFNALKDIEEDLNLAQRDANAEAVAENLKKLEEPIVRFFDTTMVMVEDPGTRSARLNLVHACADQLMIAGDFSRIVIEKG